MLAGSDVNASTTIICRSAPQGIDFAGEVRVYVSLNGVDFVRTQLTYLKFIGLFTAQRVSGERRAAVKKTVQGPRSGSS